MREGSMMFLKKIVGIAITHHNVDLIQILHHMFVTHKVDFLGIGLLQQLVIMMPKVEFDVCHVVKAD